MGIQEEIKQNKPFESEFHKLAINIQFTSSWLNTEFQKVLKPYDLTTHQFNVLRILKGQYPNSYCNQEITARMVDRSSNSTRIVDKLLAKNLITRTEHPHDRRQVDIRINENGIQILDSIEKATADFRKKMLAFNTEKARLMNEWLDELRSF